MSDDIDVGAISEALNDKMDRDAGNPADLGKERIVGWFVPDYDNAESITLNTSGVQFTPTKNGWVKLRRNPQDGTYYITMYKGTDNTGFEITGYSAAGQFNTGFFSSFIPVSKGETYFIITNNTTVGQAWFLPAKGV